MKCAQQWEYTFTCSGSGNLFHTFSLLSWLSRLGAEFSPGFCNLIFFQIRTYKDLGGGRERVKRMPGGGFPWRVGGTPAPRWVGVDPSG